MTPFDRRSDARIRAAAFEWLAEQVAVHGDVLPRTVLAQGFQLDGVRVPLVAPQGIFKPRVLDVPLSITTTPNSPYDDAFGSDGLLQYRYRGTDPQHRDNRGLRFAMQEELPLVYFHGVIPGKYVAAWPVFIVGDDPGSLRFTVAVDDAEHVGLGAEVEEAGAGAGAGPGTGAGEAREGGAEIRRQYVTSLVRTRLHQRAFRERVLDAYRRECAFCRFRHEELLDAAHIIPDADPEGEPVVSNGMSLCRLHHAAFDKYFVGVTPEYELRVRPDILEEEDGPTLEGIQSLEGQRIVLPRSRGDRPDPGLLEKRYAEFREHGERAG